MNKYVGARYMPKFMGAYDATQSYEALSVVDNGMGTSYVSNKPVPAGTPLTDTDYWAVYGSTSGAIINLQDQIDDINDDLDAINDNMDQLELMYKSGKPCIGNLLLNYFIDATLNNLYPQGGCYVKNGQFVEYYSDGNTADEGLLVCYDIASKTEVWRYNINCYHGNAVTYNPYDDNLYITGFANNNDFSVTNNYIFVVPFSNPNVISRVINLPGETMCYSLTFDPDKRKFYAICAIGTTPGTSDVLSIYDEALTTKEGSVILKDHPAVKYGANTQGVQIAIDGVAYILVYSDPMYIVGYDVTTGDILSIYNLPKYASDCRELNEAECIGYDPATKNVYVGFSSGSSEVTLEGYVVFNLVELDMFHGIEYRTPVPEIVGDTDLNQQMLLFEHESFNLNPRFYSRYNTLDTLADCLNYARIHNIAIRCVYTGSGVNNAYRPKMSGLNARLQARGSQHLKVKHCSVIGANVMFFYCDFVGGFTWATGLDTNAHFADSRVYLQSCIFEDFVSSNTKYHLVLYWNCTCVTTAVTYQGSFAQDVRLAQSMLNGVYTS